MKTYSKVLYNDENDVAFCMSGKQAGYIKITSDYWDLSWIGIHNEENGGTWAIVKCDFFFN